MENPLQNSGPMPVHTFYQQQLPASGDSFIADEKAHLRVVRMRPGEEALFLDGRGGVARCVQKDAKTQLWEVVALEQRPQPTPQGLLMPILRGAKFDWVVEKSVELGITHLGIFPAQKSHEGAIKPDRLQNLIIAAMKQSGAVFLPVIDQLPPIVQWSSIPWGLSHLYFGSLETDARWIREVSIQRPWCWAAGPESGWSEEEEKALRKLGGRPVRLHSLVLRAETAAICGLSCLAALQE